ncbi:hypothetical protein VNO77_22654 [Canavalia gladiata]|uniref:Uncharacterized protein n=1 Tax=Canavalia gladiata TaxID=3824 RepID=A0AAN9L3G7_CANGL
MSLLASYCMGLNLKNRFTMGADLSISGFHFGHSKHLLEDLSSFPMVNAIKFPKSFTYQLSLRNSKTPHR